MREARRTKKRRRVGLELRVASTRAPVLSRSLLDLARGMRRLRTGPGNRAAPAAQANRIASSSSARSARATARAPLKASPAAVVSTAVTGNAGQATACGRHSRAPRAPSFTRMAVAPDQQPRSPGIDLIIAGRGRPRGRARQHGQLGFIGRHHRGQRQQLIRQSPAAPDRATRAPPTRAFPPRRARPSPSESPVAAARPTPAGAGRPRGRGDRGERAIGPATTMISFCPVASW